MGVISAIGNSVAENHMSLVEGKCGISLETHFPQNMRAYFLLVPY
jgi:hypothetical protein